MRQPICLVLAASIALAGCASTIRSEVTVFHQWPAALPDKSYVFEHRKTPQGELEYQSYQQLVRAELRRLGFTDAASPKAAALRVAFDYAIQVHEVRMVQPVLADPYWYGNGFYAPRYYGRGGFYDPFWYGPPVAYQHTDYLLYHQQLHLSISQARNGAQLYDVTVDSESRNPSLAATMPYLVRSAFADFPGQSGVVRRVELPLEK